MFNKSIHKQSFLESNSNGCKAATLGRLKSPSRAIDGVPFAGAKRLKPCPLKSVRLQWKPSLSRY